MNDLIDLKISAPQNPESEKDMLRRVKDEYVRGVRDDFVYLLRLVEKAWINSLNRSETLTKTQKTYHGAVKLFFEYLDEIHCKKPTPEIMESYIAILKSEHKQTTVHTYAMALRQFFQFCETRGFYPDLTKDLKFKTKHLNESHKKDALTVDQINRLLGSIERRSLTGLRDYAMIRLMVTTGLRTISVSEAQINDLAQKDGKWVLYYRSKGHEDKDEYIKLVPRTERAIRAYLCKRGEQDKSAPLFASNSKRNIGGQLNSGSISRIIKNRFRAIGLDSDRLTAHSLRHTAATLALKSGVELPEVQILLAHKDINTTLIYQHEFDQLNSKAEAGIDSLLRN